MKSKLPAILAIALAVLFLSVQAFACEGSKKTDKDIGNTDRHESSMSNQGPDRDIGKDLDRSNSSTSTGQYDTNPWNVVPTP